MRPAPPPMAAAKAALPSREDALAWARERKTFGAPLAERQVIRHKLVDMAIRIDTTRSLLEDLAWRVENEAGDPKVLVAQLSMLKVHAMQAMQFCADQAVQILGGMGLMDELPLERIWRDSRVERIWEGTSEIQRHIISRSMLRPYGA